MPQPPSPHSEPLDGAAALALALAFALAFALAAGAACALSCSKMHASPYGHVPVAAHDRHGVFRRAGEFERGLACSFSSAFFCSAVAFL